MLYIDYRYTDVAQSALLCGPYRSQVWGPEGIPSHPEEVDLILPDSGERLLSWPVTTTLGPHS